MGYWYNSSLPAQSSQSGRTPESDAAWTAVIAMQKSTTAATPAASLGTAPINLPNPGQFTPPLATTSVQAKAQAFRTIAAAAKDFYSRYPTHPQAPAARKLEALSGISSILDNDSVHEQAALQVAGDYRTDKTNPIGDRFDVAHAVESHVVSKRLGGKSWLSSPAESEAMADRLQAEFGHHPKVYGNYLAVALHTTCDHSFAVAARILQVQAPRQVKTAAQRVYDRARMMRQPLDFSLTTVAGKATTLAALAATGANARTVVVFWEGDRAPAGPPGLQDFSKKPPANTNWVFVSLGAWSPPAPAAKGAKAAVKPTGAPPGTYCVEPLGLRGPVANKLKISQVPFVCVLDDKKNLNAFGRVDEIPALLAGINRVFEP